MHTPIGVMPKDYYLVTIEIPEFDNVNQIDTDELPSDWRKFPYSKLTQSIGEALISKNESLYIKVPSAVVQGDFNILINPLHRDFDKVSILKVEKFDFDERLFK